MTSPIRFTRFAVTMTAALGVAACAQLGMEEPDLGWLDPDPRPAAAPRRPDSAPARPAQAKPAAKGGELRALKPPPRPFESEGGDKLAPRLVGLSEGETADLLGRPSEETEQPPGKVWIYKAAGCQLSVHLFPDMDKGGFYALDYTSSEGTRESCLGKIAGEARRKGSALDQEAVRKG